MYEKITGQNPYATPMMIYPAVHYTMGGLWVDYNLMSTIPGLFVIGEANFSDHGANRLGASALMQGLADGYFIIPYTMGGYLAGAGIPSVTTGHDAFRQAADDARRRIDGLLSIRGKRTPGEFHRDLGGILWDYCGMSRNQEELEKAKGMVAALKEEFRKNVLVSGASEDFNQSLERALRVADFFEFGRLMVHDALDRKESCGCHFNTACQTEEHEAMRDDENCAYVAAWRYTGPDQPPELIREPLIFENVELAQRSYK
jgi:succinate dehydrogenase / fumarate reductase, flavoprotein subunit